jgi:transposase
MADQNGIVETGIKKRAVRGKWTAQQRREIVEASLVAGASINEVAERFGIRAKPVDCMASAAHCVGRGAERRFRRASLLFV